MASKIDGIKDDIIKDGGFHGWMVPRTNDIKVDCIRGRMTYDS